MLFPGRKLSVGTTVVFLSGGTRGATLESIGRSLAPNFNAHGIEFVEISLLDTARTQEILRSLNFQRVKFVFSFASMGMDISTRRTDGSNVNLWRELRI